LIRISHTFFIQIMFFENMGSTGIDYLVSNTDDM